LVDERNFLVLAVEPQLADALRRFVAGFRVASADDLVKERGFARTGNPAESDEAAQRQRAGEVAEVVDGGALDAEARRRVGHRPRGADGGLAPSAEPSACRGVLGLQDACGLAGVHEMAARGARTGPDFDEPIRRAHHRFIVFDHDDGVPLFDQASEDADHAREVARVHADAGFIEHEDGVGQAGPEAGRQVDALHLAAGERAGKPVQREVAEADRLKVAEPREHGLERMVGRVAGVLRGMRPEQRPKFGHRKRVQFGQGASLPSPPQRFFAEALASAFRALFIGAPAGEEDPHVHLVGAGLEPPEEPADAVPFRFPLAGDVRRVAVFEEPAMGGRELVPRHVHGDAFLFAGLRQVALAFAVDVALERGDGALGERQLGVGDDLLPVESDHAAEAAALGAGADRRIEREQRRRGGSEATAVDRRLEDLAVAPELRARVRQHPHATAAEAERHQGGFMEARGLRRRDGQAVLDDERFIGFRRDGLFAETEALAADERPREARPREFFGDGRPFEPGRFLDGESQDDRLAGVRLEAGFPGGGRPLGHDWLAAGRVEQFGAMGEPYLEPIAQFRHRPDRRARRAHRIALPDGDGRTDVFRGVERRRRQELEELSDVRAEGLDVATLALGMQGVEDERRFAGAAEAGHDHQLSDGDVDIEPLKVVLADSAEADGIGLGGRHRRPMNGHETGQYANPLTRVPGGQT